MTIEINRDNTKEDIPNKPKTLIFVKVGKGDKKDEKITGYDKRAEFNFVCSV